MKQVKYSLCVWLVLIVILQRQFAFEKKEQTVMSYDIIEKQLVTKEYDAIEELYAYPVSLRLSNFKKVTFASILPVYTMERGWVRSQFLEKGDKVLFLKNEKVTWVTVKNIYTENTLHVFYTYVHVHNTHTYFKDGILVHNKGDSDSSSVSSNSNSSTKTREEELSDARDAWIEMEQDFRDQEATEQNSSSDRNSSNGNKNDNTIDKDFGNDVVINTVPISEEIEAKEALETANDALDKAMEAGESYSKIQELITEREVAEQNFNSISEENRKKQEATQKGDPVLVTSGAFIHTENDFAIMGTLSQLTLKRTYTSSSKNTYAMGKGWASIIDSCLIRGSTAGLSTFAQSIKHEMQKLEVLLKNLDPYTKHESAASAISAIKVQYDDMNRTYQKLQSQVDIEKKILELNSYVITAYTPTHYYHNGANFLTYVDEKGSDYVFEYVGNGEWIPTDRQKAQYMKIVSKDGKDSLTEKGFILSEKMGKEIWFDKWGLREKDVDKNGNETLYVRDNNTKKLISIQSPEGRKIQFVYGLNGFLTELQVAENKTVFYEYDGLYLSSVTDIDGDKSRFEYNANGLLVKFIKPDESFVAFDYELHNEDGDYLITKTTNEEGYSEYFMYDVENKYTTYTTHTGFKELVYYDKNHRTVKEVSKTGYTSKYTYDDFGNIATQSINGNMIQFSYDTRGNKVLEKYSDGSKKIWVYNGFDQITKYTDRDGKTWSVTYDEKGNATEFRNGGVLVESALYGPKGNIHTVIDYKGNKTTFEYDDAYNVIQKTSGTIKEFFEHDEFGNIITYTDGENRQWSYTHGSKNIVEISPTGLQREYTVNNRKDIVKIEERDSLTSEKRVFEYEYDKRHLLHRVMQDNKTLMSYTYYPSGEIKTITHGENKMEDIWVTEYELLSGFSYAVHRKKINDKNQQEGTIYSELYTLDKGTLTHMIPLNRTKILNFDAWNRVTSIENAANESLKRVLSPEGRILQEQSQYSGWYESHYNEQGLLSATAEKNDKGISFVYNPNGAIVSKTDQNNNTINYEYNAQGLLIQEIRKNGSIFYTYDAIGRVTSIVWGKTNNIQNAEQYIGMAYAKDSRSITIDYGGVYTEVLELNAWGEIIKRIDGEGNTFKTLYNALAQVVKTIDAYNNETVYEYNAIGKVAKILYADKTEVMYTYNNLGQLESIKDVLGVQWQGFYDEAGRLVKEEGRNNIKKEYMYDELNRLIGVNRGGMRVETYDYSEYSKNVIFKDGNNKEYTYLYDNFGRLTHEENRLGNFQHYAYNSAGQLVSKKDFNQNIQTIAYDFQDAIKSINYGNDSESTFEYSITGRIVKASNKTGTIFFTYNKAGLLESQYDEKAGETIYYMYDNAGRRKRYVSGNRDVVYTYGKNGELLHIVDNSQHLSVSFTYDIMMRETSRSFANGVKQHTFYDTTGRIILITELKPNGEVLRSEGYVYNKAGQISIKINEKALVTKYEYDTQGRLITVLYPYSEEKVEFDKNEVGEAGFFLTENMSKGTLLYLSHEEIKEISELLNTISYARSNSLRTVQSVWKETYSYDNNSNRITKSNAWGTIQYRYDFENRLIHSGAFDNGTTYTYDANGNLLGKYNSYRTEQFLYDATNRMVKSIIGDNSSKSKTSTTYAYDAFGRRNIVQSEGLPAMRTLYDGLSHDIIKESETFLSGAFTTNFTSGGVGYSYSESSSERYLFVEDTDGNDGYKNVTDYKNNSMRFTGEKMVLYAKGSAVGLCYTKSTSENILYFGTDILGSVRSTSQNYGELESLYEYDAFGNAYKGSFISGLSNGYLGKPFDAETKLYNYGYRDYAPQEARFTSVDPVRDGNNWFSYVGNDPINFIDLWGLSASDVGNWTNNGDGTYTAKEGAMLWELNATGQNWTESDYVGKPEDLQIGQTVSFGGRDENTVMSDNTSYAEAVAGLSASSVPQTYDCADVALWIYGKASEISTGKNSSSDFNAGGYPLGDRPIPAVHSSDFAPSEPDNVTYYRDDQGNIVVGFDNPHVKTGDILVWKGHVATVTGVDRKNGNVVSITILQGHLDRAPDRYRIKNQDDLETFIGLFYGFAEINKR